MKFYLYAIGIWFVMAIFAIINGVFRVKVIIPEVGTYAGHIISTLMLMSIILIITYIFLKQINVNYSKSDLIYVGLLWLFLTVAFEFGFGHYVEKIPWETLLADYNIFKGRIWVLVLVTTLLAPYLTGLIQRK